MSEEKAKFIKRTIALALKKDPRKITYKEIKQYLEYRPISKIRSLLLVSSGHKASRSMNNDDAQLETADLIRKFFSEFGINPTFGTRFNTVIDTDKLDQLFIDSMIPYALQYPADSLASVYCEIYHHPDDCVYEDCDAVDENLYGAVIVRSKKEIVLFTLILMAMECGLSFGCDSVIDGYDCPYAVLMDGENIRKKIEINNYRMHKWTAGIKYFSHKDIAALDLYEDDGDQFDGMVITGHSSVFSVVVSPKISQYETYNAWSEIIDCID